MSREDDEFSAFKIRPVRRDDADIWEQLRSALWPDGSAEHNAEIAAFFEGRLEEPVAVFVAETAAGKLIAVAELSIRTGLPALEGRRTGYIEGLYVIPEARPWGVGRSMIRASRNWARQMGCDAFGSDRAERIIVDGRF